MNLLVVGVGYVGLVTGVCFAEMGHLVTCLDVDQRKIDQLKSGQTPFFEPGLEELVLRNQKQKRLFFTSDYREGMRGAEVCLIAVGTPSLLSGAADLSQVMEAATKIGKEIKEKSTVILKSTVPVGTTRMLQKQIQDILDSRDVSAPLTVLFNPEFLKEGSAIDDCMKPDRIIIGTDAGRGMEIAKLLYSSFNLNRDRMMEMSFESAELTKYASNAMLATRISFMNEMASFCEQMGANIHEVRKGMSGDQRIGSHFLYAGAGYGGSCFGKDIRALQSMATLNCFDTNILDAVEKVNENQKKRLPQKVIDYFEEDGGIEGKGIAIWGLSYKPNTDDMREASSLTLIEILKSCGAHLRLYDPVATQRAKSVLPSSSSLNFCSSEYEAAENADAIVLMTEWKQFRFVDLSRVLASMRGRAFFDGRNQYRIDVMEEKGFDYFGVGISKRRSSLFTDA